MSINIKGSRKAINFDLDTNRLKLLYPLGEKRYRRAYDDLNRFFEKNGFEHRQGSGYSSQGKLTNADIWDLIERVQTAFPWIAQCINRIDVTDIGKVYDLKPLFSLDDGDIKPEVPQKNKARKQHRRGKSQDCEIYFNS